MGDKLSLQITPVLTAKYRTAERIKLPVRNCAQNRWI